MADPSEQDEIDRRRIQKIDWELSDPRLSANDRRHFQNERDQIVGTMCCGWCRHWIRMTEMSDRRIAEVYNVEVPVAPGRCGHPTRGGGSVLRAYLDFDPSILPSRVGADSRSSCGLRER